MPRIPQKWGFFWDVFPSFPPFLGSWELSRLPGLIKVPVFRYLAPKFGPFGVRRPQIPAVSMDYSEFQEEFSLQTLRIWD